MKNEEASASDRWVPLRGMHNAVPPDSGQSQHEIQKLRSRIAQLESALSQSHSTAELIAHKQEAEGQRRNVNDAVREALITSLQSDNKQLLIRIDKDALELATAETRVSELSTQLILAHEQEQRRIAREIHDELGQELTALRMALLRGAGTPGTGAERLLKEAATITESLLQTVRYVCNRLRPQVLDDLGLVAGISVQLKNFGDRTGLNIEFVHDEEIDEQRLTPLVQSVVFRVIQEAVTNVARHAQTRQARVTLGMDVKYLVFTIEDNGRGFDPERVRNVPSTGVTSMVERLLLVDGICEIESAPGKGTRIQAKIPLKS